MSKEIRYSFSKENTKVLFDCWKKIVQPGETDEPYTIDDFLAQLDAKIEQ